MMSMKENGTDIAVWTLEELKIIVEDFKNSFAPMPLEEEEKSESDKGVESEGSA